MKTLLASAAILVAATTAQAQTACAPGTHAQAIAAFEENGAQEVFRGSSKNGKSRLSVFVRPSTGDWVVVTTGQGMICFQLEGKGFEVLPDPIQVGAPS